MTDDEAITLVLLHGCLFVSSSASIPIPPSREALAHAYCEHFGLGTDLATIKSPHPETPTTEEHSK